MRLLNETREQPGIEFSVVDTGIGLSDEQMSRLFKPFSQADESTTRKYGGTGLGLAISRKLVTLLGGEMKVTSEPGKGSCFSFVIPTGSLEGIRIVEDPASVRYTPSVTESKEFVDSIDCRVLVVEDNVVNQKLVARILSKAGALVELAADGSVGVEKALAAEGGDAPFDIVLMDMQMPVMDGYEATGVLREKGFTKPIVAVTAHAMVGDGNKCLEAGCDAYATKPYDKRALLDTIRGLTFGQPS